MKILKTQLKDLLNEIENKEIYASDTDVFICYEFDNIHISFDYNFNTRHVSEFQFYIGESLQELDSEQYYRISKELEFLSLKWLSMRSENMETIEVNGIYYYN